VKRRGFLLVTVLLLMILMLTLGMTFLGKRSAQYRRASLVEQALVARSLAEAGMEDARLKLQRDLLFPQQSDDQTLFSYSEVMSVNGVRVGSYTVTIDNTYKAPPFLILVVRSMGQAGRDPSNPTATRRFRAEYDLSQQMRDNPSNPNAFYRQLIQFQDLGGL